MSKKEKIQREGASTLVAALNDFFSIANEVANEQEHGYQISAAVEAHLLEAHKLLCQDSEK